MSDSQKLQIVGYISIRVPVLNDICINVFTDKETLISWLFELGYKEKADNFKTDVSIDATSFSLESPSNETLFGAWIPKEADIFTICHECLHLAWFLLDYTGIRVDAYNHEILAYLQGYLFKQIAQSFGID